MDIKNKAQFIEYFSKGIKDIDPEDALKIQQVADSIVQEFFKGE